MTTCTDHAFSTFFARLYHLGNPFVLFASKQRYETKIGKKSGDFLLISLVYRISRVLNNTAEKAIFD